MGVSCAGMIDFPFPIVYIRPVTNDREHPRARAIRLLDG